MSTDQQRPTPFYLSPSTISLHRAASSKGNVTRRVDKETRASLPDFAVVAQVSRHAPDTLIPHKTTTAVCGIVEGYTGQPRPASIAMKHRLKIQNQLSQPHQHITNTTHTLSSELQQYPHWRYRRQFQPTLFRQSQQCLSVQGTLLQQLGRV